MVFLNLYALDTGMIRTKTSILVDGRLQVTLEKDWILT